MLDLNELRKHFNPRQQQDMIELEALCLQTPPGRIRRGRVRKVKPNHIPRPVNSFMTYRTEKQAIVRQFCPTANHRDISKMVAKWWHSSSLSEKNVFFDKAKQAKDVHNEKYPNYTFRPKAKRLDKKNANKNKKNESAVNGNQSENSTSSARTRSFTKPTMSVHQQSHVISPANIFDCSTPMEANAMYNAGMMYTHVDNNDNMMFDTCNTIYNNAMYNDDVLFKTNQDVGFWNDNNTLESSEQIISNAFPSILSEQHNYDNMPLGYYPSPTTQDVITQNVDPMSTIIMPNQQNNFNLGYLNQFDCQVTPQSQAMSTPRLAYPGSPSTPPIENCLFQNNTSLFGENLPIALLSPSAANNNTTTTTTTNNTDFLSTWSTNYGNNTSFLTDSDFWG